MDETWALKKPSKDQVEGRKAPAHSRIITIEKSRAGRSGTSLIMQMEDDLSFSVADFTPEVDPDNTAPSSTTDRVLQRLRVIYPRLATKTDLNADPVVGGKVAAIQKSLQRLVKRGLICEVEVPGDKRYKQKTYQAVLAGGDLPYGVQSEQKPSAGTDVRVDSPVPSEEVSTLDLGADDKGGHPEDVDGGCPPSETSHSAESAHDGHSGQYPRARQEERTPEEINRARQASWDFWNT